MVIDPTASEFFFRSSIKKYMMDSFFTGEGVLVIFDKTILYEEVMSYGVSKWIVVNFGSFKRGLFSKNILDISCCTRKDEEGVVLSKLTDIVISYLTDITKTDTMKRITLFNTTDTDPLNWTEVGKMLVLDNFEGAQSLTADRTKVKTITTLLSWVSII